jgi:hypothetical protein
MFRNWTLGAGAIRRATIGSISLLRTGQGTMRTAGMNFKGVFTRDRRSKLAAHSLRSR